MRKRGERWRETRSQQQIQNTKLRSVSSSEICSVRLGSSQLGNVWETMKVYGGATYSICWLEKEQFCCKSLVWYLGHSELHICIRQVMWLTPARRSKKHAALKNEFHFVCRTNPSLNNKKRHFFFTESRRGNSKAKQ